MTGAEAHRPPHALHSRRDKRDCASIRRTHPAAIHETPQTLLVLRPHRASKHHTAYLHVAEMTDATKGAPAPKKRSLFKRAAWQDAAKKENDDIFSHSNEFKDLVAEESRQKEEEKRKQAEVRRKAEEEQKREKAEKQDKKGKRRKVSTDYEEPILLHSDSVDSGTIGRSQSNA